jgi:hypothetical protein
VTVVTSWGEGPASVDEGRGWRRASVSGTDNRVAAASGDGKSVVRPGGVGGDGSGACERRSRQRQTKILKCGAGKNAARKGKGWFPNPPRFVG